MKRIQSNIGGAELLCWGRRKRLESRLDGILLLGLELSTPEDGSFSKLRRNTARLHEEGFYDTVTTPALFRVPC